MLIAIPKALSLRAVRSYGRDKLVPSLMKFLGVFIRSGFSGFSGINRRSNPYPYR